jgi:riboflavin kinase/FMN adenylyltransferase
MISLRGIVVKGKGEARTLGYPTANIQYELSHTISSGVWLCTVLYGQQRLAGLAVVGMWRLENGLPSVEVHILDFELDIYGKQMDICLVKKIRDLEKFMGIDALIKRIEEDIVVARRELQSL